jgi:hypothetical protein
MDRQGLIDYGANLHDYLEIHSEKLSEYNLSRITHELNQLYNVVNYMESGMMEKHHGHTRTRIVGTLKDSAINV